MHELAVTESIIDICLKHAYRNHARKITKVNLVLGELTGIVDQCVTFYWEMLAKDTIASGAEICFRKIPVRARCRECNEEFGVQEFDLTCPRCGNLKSELISGREFQVESIEIE
jgi:hydrogenase nickel incorporation protein HypA/HybF